MQPLGPKKVTTLALVSFTALFSAPRAFAIDVRFCTDRGAVDVELDEQRAPAHVANFLRQAESGFYGDTVFHRVVAGSMVQGGRYDTALERREADQTVVNESGNGLSNTRGTIAASRAEGPDSATAAFFFNLTDNSHLDATPGSPGYTVFGRVTAGLDVLDEIAALPTRRTGDLQDVPVPLVGLDSVVSLDRAPVFGLSIEPDPATLARDFDAARARGDSRAILGAADALRRSCVALDPSQRLAEADAANALGLVERARYSLEAYLANAAPFDSERSRAERLRADLPVPEPSRNADDLLAQCRRPAAPTVPNGRFTEQSVLATVEGEVRRYRQIGELYLGCVERRIGQGDLDETETIAVTDRHNEMVAEMTAVFLRFNQAVRTFRDTQ